MSKPPEVIAEIRDYQQLVAAFRKRMNEIATTGEIIDEVGGMPDGYTTKLLAPVPVRMISRMSFGLLLTCTGTKLLMVPDEESWIKIRKRMTKSRFNRWHAGISMPASSKRRKRGYFARPAIAKIARQRQAVAQTPARRRAIARRAAVMRWTAVRART